MIQKLPTGGYRFEYFASADNLGYGKLYVQIVDASGKKLDEFKDTMGPSGFIERKWQRGGRGR